MTKIVIGLILGLCLICAYGMINEGGSGTYQMQMSYDGRIVAVMDTRTGLVKTAPTLIGCKASYFNNDERILRDYGQKNR